MQEMTPEQLAALGIPMGDAQGIFERRFEDEDVQVAGEICKDVTEYVMQKYKKAKRDHVGSAIMSLALATVASAIHVVRVAGSGSGEGGQPKRRALRPVRRSNS